ncbi:MAG: sigma-70 family RNA polymerase sigma factor [Verrucomicrobiales bacterium]|nr:sigma-70 family RNA polymerase sigma factor [Verrucomicrobiales bacterium]
MNSTAAAQLPTRASLLERLRNPADAATWQEFHQLYRPLVVAVARRAGVGEDAAEDLAQETFIAVLKALPGFRYEPARSSFKHWLRTLTTHRIAEYFRARDGRTGARARVMAHEQPGTKVLENVPDPRGPELEALWEEEWRHVREQVALERLKTLVKPQHFQVFQFTREGKSAAETARALGVNVASVYLIKHRVANVLRRVAKELEKWEA